MGTMALRIGELRKTKYCLLKGDCPLISVPVFLNVQRADSALCCVSYYASHFSLRARSASTFAWGTALIV